MQTRNLETAVEQAGTFTEIIRSNFRRVYDAYFSATAIANEDNNSKKLDNKEYVTVG